ncbi:MAG: hypothetical protein GXZ11_01425 [Tissierellia bacterium]|nr:hypothetical protein [Tissierellia bacterium]
MDMMMVIGKIDEDIINLENRDEVYDIMRTLQRDVVMVDEEGNEIMTKEEQIAIERLKAMGETKVIENWLE